VLSCAIVVHKETWVWVSAQGPGLFVVWGHH